MFDTKTNAVSYSAVTRVDNPGHVRVATPESEMRTTIVHMIPREHAGIIVRMRAAMVRSGRSPDRFLYLSLP